jgi:hypothetical protein
MDDELGPPAAGTLEQFAGYEAAIRLVLPHLPLEGLHTVLRDLRSGAWASLTGSAAFRVVPALRHDVAEAAQRLLDGRPWPFPLDVLPLAPDEASSLPE